MIEKHYIVHIYVAGTAELVTDFRIRAIRVHKKDDHTLIIDGAIVRWDDKLYVDLKDD